MKNNLLLVGLAALMALPAAIAQAPPPPPDPGQAGAAPAFAFDIPKSDIDLLVKSASAAENQGRTIDNQIRVVDMGKSNMGIAVI